MNRVSYSRTFHSHYRSGEASRGRGPVPALSSEKKTRASVAKERGLEPLSEWIWNQPKQGNVLDEAASYVNEELGVESAEAALAGALDILAENIADDAEIRKWVRRYTLDHGVLTSEAKDTEVESVYENYYSYRELAKKNAATPHSSY